MQPKPPKQPKPHPFTEEQISAKAKALWEQRGEDSTDAENWADAISELQREQAISAKAQQLWELRLLKLRESDKRTAEDDWRDAQARLHESGWTQFMRWTGISEKKGWDVVQLLVGISIPIVLFAGGQYFTSQNNEKQQKLADERAQQDRQLADDKAKQDTLVKYLDQMADSLQHGLLKAKPGDDQFIVAQSRTVLALQSLDKKRQHLVIQFLSASGLNDGPDDNWQARDKQGQPNPLPAQSRTLLYAAQLTKANLANSDLSGAVLLSADLNNANFSCNPPESQEPNQCSDLSSADLRGANLYNAGISGANLSGANLSGANFYNADLSGANLSGADLSRTDFRDAVLEGAVLSGADLNSAHLGGAILLHTDLHQATNLIPEQLEGKEPPLLCNVALLKGFAVNPNRDCDRLPPVLVKRDPVSFKTLKDAENYVYEARQKKWTDEPLGK